MNISSLNLINSFKFILNVFSIFIFISWQFFGFLAIPSQVFSQENDSSTLQVEIENAQFMPGEQAIPTPTFSPSSQKRVEQTENEIHVIGYESEDQKTHGFVFSVSNYLLDFGELSPTNPLTRVLNISLRDGSPFNSAIFTWEDHPLMMANSTQIPDTTCDNGTCDEQTSATWNNTLAYGYGYTCENASTQACLSDFHNGTLYQHFPDLSAKEPPFALLSTNSYLKSKAAKLNFRLNTAGTQPTGTYTNRVFLIAVPGY